MVVQRQKCRKKDWPDIQMLEYPAASNRKLLLL